MTRSASYTTLTDATFVLQAVGHVTLVSGPHRKHTGWEAALVAAALALITLSAILSLGNVYQCRRLIPLLVEMARGTLDDERQPHPRANLLPGWLAALGFERRDGEDDLAFARRVADVENLIVNVNARPGMNESCTRLWTEPPLEGER